MAITTEVERWIGSGDWLNELGDVVLTFTEQTELRGLAERRVMFADGTDVDLVPVPENRVDEVVSEGGALPVLARGYRLLVDKDGRFADLPARVATADPTATHTAAPWPPDPPAVLNEVHNYLYHAVWTAKKLRRGELAVAVSCQNAFQGRSMRRFVEWQAKVRDPATNTFYDGRFLERWAPAETVAGLAVSQSRYESTDCARAIVEGLDLFRTLAREVGAAAGAPYPEGAHAWTRDRLRALLGR